MTEPSAEVAPAAVAPASVRPSTVEFGFGHGFAVASGWPGRYNAGAAGLLSTHVGWGPGRFRLRLALEGCPLPWSMIDLGPTDYLGGRFAAIRLTVGAQVHPRWELGVVGGLALLPSQDWGVQARWLAHANPATGFSTHVVMDTTLLARGLEPLQGMAQVQVEFSYRYPGR